MTGPKRYKLCTSCGESKPVEEFYRRKTGYLARWCKPCDIADVARRKSAKRAEVRAAQLARPELPPPTEQQCVRCGEVKPIAEFRKRENGRVRKDCKACQQTYLRDWYAKPENRARVAANNQAYAELRPERERNRRLARYGLTAEQYDALYDAQQGCCAVCGMEKARAGGGDVGGGNVLCVDHNHDTGAIRGLLCTGCNRAIGLLGDDPARLIAAANYLRAGESDARHRTEEGVSAGR